MTTLSTVSIDMDFLELVNKRLDHLKEYCYEQHYLDSIYYARRWCSYWKEMKSADITVDMVQAFLLKRKRDVSAITANKELRLLRSLFNFGMKAPQKWIFEDPTSGIEFFPVEKKEKRWHLTLRRIPLNQKLFGVLSQRHKERDKDKPWVFWHRYWSVSEGELKSIFIRLEMVSVMLLIAWIVVLKNFLTQSLTQTNLK